jgi:hypothetical protein
MEQTPAPSLVTQIWPLGHGMLVSQATRGGPPPPSDSPPCPITPAPVPPKPFPAPKPLPPEPGPPPDPSPFLVWAPSLAQAAKQAAAAKAIEPARQAIEKEPRGGSSWDMFCFQSAGAELKSK